MEVLEKAKKENTIIFLETSSRKTLIAVMLLRSYAFAIRKPLRHIAIFLIPTIILVTQQAKVIEMHTALKVCKLWGEMDVDFWDADTWKENLEEFEEWDALMLSNFALENQLHTARQQLKMANECCSIQLIDGDVVFNVTSLEHFMKSVKLAKHGLSYAVVSIMGPQSSCDVETV
ncbi:hypothetical protein ZIOFF_026822 [Zingiber officinale]|uniref:Prp19 coiled-coil region domain-containing protein n=1 Tax=Zingiber officinale TaxID=94328 RepID=A0A8J5LKS1_ZINOF|nr:hypothetical protein ZIOFF_026822 [Zingiber officinale]